MSVEEMFLGVQESYQEAQQRAQEENRAFARTEFFRMDKFGTYRLRVLPIAPNPDGSQVTVTRATDAGYSVDPIETYRRLAVEAAKEAGDEKLAEKIAGGSFGGGLKYNYGHCLYIFDLGERAKGVQMMTLSHAQFKDLDERKFKLWSKKLAKNPSYPCPVSSVYDAYPVEIEKRRNGAKTEYLFSIDNESDPEPLTREELTALLGAPRIPEIIYRYTRYHLGATVEFLKQCDGIYGMRLMETDEMKEVIQQLSDELPKEDTSSFSFDRRTKDNKDNVQDGTGISLDDLLEYYDELRRQDLGDKTEEGQELRAMIRSYIEQEALSVRVTRSTSNRELLELIESEMEGPKPTDTPEDAPREEEHRLAETEERAERPRRRR